MVNGQHFGEDIGKSRSCVTRNFSEIQWWNRTSRAVEEICALHRTGSPRFHVWVMIVLEMLTLMVLVLMMHGPIVFTFRLRLSPHLSPRFALRLGFRTVKRRDMGRSTVSITDRKYDRRDDNIFRGLRWASRAFRRIGTSTVPRYLAERTAFQHTAASLSKTISRRDSWSFSLPAGRWAVANYSN
jgi:hypothetical protein